MLWLKTIGRENEYKSGGDDANYTCRVANALGVHSKTANVCESHAYCIHALNSCTFIQHVPTWHFDWVLRVELGVSLSGC